MYKLQRYSYLRYFSLLLASLYFLQPYVTCSAALSIILTIITTLLVLCYRQLFRRKNRVICFYIKIFKKIVILFDNHKFFNIKLTFLAKKNRFCLWKK